MVDPDCSKRHTGLRCLTVALPLFGRRVPFGCGTHNKLGPRRNFPLVCALKQGERKSMSDYAFKIGQVIEYTRPARFIGAAPGHYEVVQRMPQEGFDYMYRIKSPNELHVRVANESDLSVPN